MIFVPKNGEFRLADSTGHYFGYGDVGDFTIVTVLYLQVVGA